MAPFLMSRVDRIKPPEKEKEIVEKIVYVPSSSPPTKPTYDQDIELTPRQAELIQNKTLGIFAVTVVYAGAGALIGSVAGPVGAAIGGTVGAAIGFFAEIFGY